MIRSDAKESRRSVWRGVAQVVRFNWPKYAAALVVLLLAALVWMRPTPVTAKWVAALLMLPTAFWSIGSVCASHWIYDRSPLSDWRWLPGVATDGRAGIGDWINIHAGFDDTTLHLRRHFPDGQQAIIDLHDPTVTTEHSVQRARAWQSESAAGIAGRPDALPVSANSVDTVFLLFAAHELRAAAEREALFRELHRVLRQDGRIVLVEHLRDVWNGLAFGPGAWHFFSGSEWRRVAADADLAIAREGSITPFVHWFLLKN